MPIGDISFANGQQIDPAVKGRQLQTIEFGGSQTNDVKPMIKVTFVKLVLRQNHPNRDNQYNQVSKAEYFFPHLRARIFHL